MKAAGDPRVSDTQHSEARRKSFLYGAANPMTWFPSAQAPRSVAGMALNLMVSVVGLVWFGLVLRQGLM